jgi:hypothetical protein
LNGLLSLLGAAGLTCVLASGTPTPLLAQTPALDLRGVVVSAETDEPIPSPTIAISGGRPIFGGSAGAFVLRGVAPGPLQLRIEQIGYEALDTTVVVQAGANEVHRFALAPRPIVLEGLEVVAVPEACTETGFQATHGDERLAALMEEFRRNAERLQLLLSDYPLHLTYEWTERQIGDESAVLAEKTASISSTTGADEPYSAGGVIISRLEQGQMRYSMRIPTVVDLATPEFERNHCFYYAGLDAIAGDKYHRVDFEPSTAFSAADVAGSLYLDRESLILRRAEFRLVRIPRQARYTSALRIITSYREFRPFLVIPHHIFGTQAHRRFRSAGRQVHWTVDEYDLVEHHFLDGEPGDSNHTPEPSTSDGER